MRRSNRGGLESRRRACRGVKVSAEAQDGGAGNYGTEWRSQQGWPECGRLKKASWEGQKQFHLEMTD